MVRSRVLGSRQIEKILAEIQPLRGGRPSRADLRGGSDRQPRTHRRHQLRIVFDQIKSVSLALLVIFAVMALMLPVGRVGLLAILPNVLAITVFFGLLGWFSVYPQSRHQLDRHHRALGIAVDSSVTYMRRLSRELRGESDQARGDPTHHARCRRADVVHYAALAAGFLTLRGSSFPPIRNFGLLTSITLVAAFGANLIVLAGAAGDDQDHHPVGPHSASSSARTRRGTIPLLGGLRPAQSAHRRLMGELRHFPPGARIAKSGEQGNEMYVIVERRYRWSGSATVPIAKVARAAPR